MSPSLLDLLSVIREHWIVASVGALALVLGFVALPLAWRRWRKRSAVVRFFRENFDKDENFDKLVLATLGIYEKAEAARLQKQPKPLTRKEARELIIDKGVDVFLGVLAERGIEERAKVVKLTGGPLRSPVIFADSAAICEEVGIKPGCVCALGKACSACNKPAPKCEHRYVRAVCVSGGDGLPTSSCVKCATCDEDVGTVAFDMGTGEQTFRFVATANSGTISLDVYEDDDDDDEGPSEPADLPPKYAVDPLTFRAHPVGEAEPEKPKPAPLKIGQWVRVKKTGDLCVVESVGVGRHNLIGARTSDLLRAFDASELEVAVPCVGERWQYAICEKKDCFGSDHVTPDRSHSFLEWENGRIHDDDDIYLVCGCLRPVNFGRG